MILKLRYLCLLSCLWLAAVLAIAPPLHAQGQLSSITPDYVAWDKLAEDADERIATGEATTAELEALRAQVSDWRQQFLNMQSVNATAIKTVQDQLASIGPIPEGGEEPANISEQRRELERRLARLQAPIKLAELARSRAEGLISEIDSIIRSRQTEELLRLGPSPLNPLHWPEAVKTLYMSLEVVRSEVATNWQSSFRRGRFQDSLPAIVGLGAISLLLVALGARWAKRLSNLVRKNGGSAIRQIAYQAITLGEWILPLLGIFLLFMTAVLTGFLGPKSLSALSSLVQAAAVFLVARWLAVRFFPSEDRKTLTSSSESGDSYSARFSGLTFGLVTAALFFVKDLAETLKWSEEARNVIIFPILVLAALMVWRLSRLLARYSKAVSSDQHSDDGFLNKLVLLFARALSVLAVIAPLLGGIGYLTAADAILLPLLLSLMLLAVLLLLKKVLAGFYATLTGHREGAEDSLLPLLGGYVLIIAFLPGFALIWGARPSQIQDAWVRFTHGASFGGITISPIGFLTLAVVFAIGFVITRVVQSTLKSTILPKTRLDVGGRNAIISGVGYIGIFLSVLIAVTSAGIDLSSLAIVAGALSVGIGFGLQNIVSNFVAGIILLIERPISEGDWIEVGGQQGYVRSISVRSTRIETFDRTDVIVPNADFVSGRVTNYTRGNTIGRVIVSVGVAYGSDTRRVEAILRDIAEKHPMVLMKPPPVVLLMGFGASSLDFQIRAILRDVNWVSSVKSDMNHEIVRRFAEEGIEIPFPQTDLWFRNSETLMERPGGAKSDKTAPSPGEISQKPLKSEGDMSEGPDEI